MTLERSANARRAWDSILRGGIGAAADARAALGEDAIGLAWCAALDAARWHAAPESVFPTIAQIRSLAEKGGAEARLPCALACAAGVRASVLAFDREGLSR